MRTILWIGALILTSALRAEDEVKPPLELQLLQEKRQDAIRKIDTTYRAELEKLKVAYTKRGDLDAANAVAAILKEMQSPDPGLETRWKWGTGGELVLKPDGTATHTLWKNQGKWKKNDDGSIELDWS